jgi:hypothetical protein
MIRFYPQDMGGWRFDLFRIRNEVHDVKHFDIFFFSFTITLKRILLVRKIFLRRLWSYFACLSLKIVLHAGHTCALGVGNVGVVGMVDGAVGHAVNDDGGVGYIVYCVVTVGNVGNFVEDDGNVGNVGKVGTSSQ